MISNNVFRYWCVAVLFFFVFISGCGGPGADLALRLIPNETTTYRVVTEKEDSITFAGDVGDSPEFEDKITSSRLDMTFAQQIQQIDEKGNAEVKITVKDLKWKTTELNKTKLDFDSAQVKDKRNPLACLIGQSYTIKISPSGKIVRIVSTVDATAAVRSKGSSPNMALILLKPGVIKERHECFSLPSVSKNPLKKGDTWSLVKEFDFGLMGKKSYERIYSLNDVAENKDGSRIAVVEMKAIPDTVGDGEPPAPTFLSAFDNVESYTGLLKLDLVTGQVDMYEEELRTKWVVVDPQPQKGNTEPVRMTMASVRSYNLEKKD